MNSNLSEQKRNVRVYKKTFTIVDNKLIRDPNLDHTTKMCLIMILSLPESWVFNRNGLVKVLNLSSVQVLDRILKKLILFGYHRKFRYKNEYIYCFYAESLLIDELKANYLGENGIPRKLTEEEVEKLDKRAYILCETQEEIERFNKINEEITTGLY